MIIYIKDIFAPALEFKSADIDYLINGDSDEKTKSVLMDTELLRQFKAMEQINESDRTII